MTEDKNNRYLYEQFAALQRDFHESLAAAVKELGKEMNALRDRHHEAINHLGAQGMQVQADVTALRVDIANIKTQLFDHTHQLVDIKRELAVDAAREKGAAQQRTSTKAISAWVLGGITTLLGVF